MPSRGNVNGPWWGHAWAACPRRRSEKTVDSKASYTCPSQNISELILPPGWRTISKGSGDLAPDVRFHHDSGPSVISRRVFDTPLDKSSRLWLMVISRPWYRILLLITKTNPDHRQALRT